MFADMEMCISTRPQIEPPSEKLDGSPAHMTDADAPLALSMVSILAPGLFRKHPDDYGFVVSISFSCR